MEEHYSIPFSVNNLIFSIQKYLYCYLWITIHSLVEMQLVQHVFLHVAGLALVAHVFL